MVSAFVFLSAAALAFGMMAVVAGAPRGEAPRGRNRAPASARRRTDDPRSLRYASKVAAQRLIDYTTKHYSGENAGEMKELRRRLIQAGYPRSARARFLLPGARGRGGRARRRGVPAARRMLLQRRTARMFWPMVLIGGILGYFAPNIYLSRRIAARQVEHRAGFPDFMDLLVVCADAGLSMEAALDRVGRELADSLSLALAPTSTWRHWRCAPGAP